jgi:hypothetical protein
MAAILLSFLLITVVGGILAQRLQHQNWIRQQHISSQDRRIEELKTIFVEFDSLLSRRLYRARRLLYSLRRGHPEAINTRLKDYDAIVCEWNDKRNSLQIRLVRVISVSLAQQFEHDLSRRFVSIGSQLERLTRATLENTAIARGRSRLTELEQQLNSLSRAVYEFSREIYKSLQLEQDQLLYIDKHRRIPQLESELESVSTWYLFKALFIPPTKFGEET